jgi:alpha,alpha-trehalase
VAGGDRRGAAHDLQSAWTFAYSGYLPAEEGRREALCTVGNGYLATRGAVPETACDGVHYPGTYAAGLYNRLTDTVAGETVENESLVNLPNWLFLTLRIDGGRWFTMETVTVLDHGLELDLHAGVLRRVTRFRDGQGRTTRLEQWRFAHMAEPHLCGLRTTITAEDWTGRLEVRSAIDATVRNAGVLRYASLSGRHLRQLAAAECAPDTVLMLVETVQSKVRIAECARTQVHGDNGPCRAERRPVADPGWIGQDVSVDVGAGETVTVDKVVAIHTSRDRAITEPATAAAECTARAPGFDDLLAAHIRAWARLWRRCWIDMNGSQTLQPIRLHMFHLLQTASEHTVDLDTGIPARGLHGEAYRGHVLWDELFAFPILNLRVPLAARALLRYRYRRLPAARRAAAEAGHAGAMYPWQSGSDGREESQRRHLNPVSGHWLPDVSHRQRHIGLAVAYNVWQYYQATGDEVFFSHYGAEMILDIARFWSSIATYDRDRDRYSIRGVMGPDEFHTGYPDRPLDGIDNNAYTNVMVCWLLERALATLDALPDPRRLELTDALGLAPTEAKRWDELSRKLYVPFHSDGIISQFEGYEDLAELDWERCRGSYPGARRLDRLLEADGDSPNRYRASKQADVLMLFYLMSADELMDVLGRLGYSWDPALIPPTIDYYLARTSHGSTLSAVVHAWVLARAHRHRALEYFSEALRSDIADIQGGTTAEGIHLGAMAGTVDVLQRCFAGVEIRGETLYLNPYWPAELGTLEFTMRYRGHVLSLSVTGKQVRVWARGGTPTPIRLCCHDRLTELAAGQSVELRFPGQA